MKGFHSAWRGISSHESARTTRKKSANSTVGNNMGARGVLAEVCLAVYTCGRLRRRDASPLGDRFADLLRLKQEQSRELDQVALQILRAQLEAGASAELGEDRLAVAGSVEQRDQQPGRGLLHAHPHVGERDHVGAV